MSPARELLGSLLVGAIWLGVPALIFWLVEHRRRYRLLQKHVKNLEATLELWKAHDCREANRDA